MIKEKCHINNIFIRICVLLAFVTSLQLGTTFLLSPVVGVLTDRIGIRMTTFIGGAIAATGMFISSFLTDQVISSFILFKKMYNMYM